MQEEIRRSNRDGSSSKNEYEENFTLAAKARKGKGKKFHPKSKAKGKKLDFSKVKCFHYHKHGHLATKCPQKKKNKKVAGDVVVRPLPRNLNLISLLSHAWFQAQWDRCGILIVVLPST